MLAKISFSIFLLGIIFFSGISLAEAATNISATTTDHWAWSDTIGWIDFYNTNSITVGSANVTGYASSSAGEISLDCATTSVGNICGTSNYQITNDALGNFSNWGWNDLYGWFSFDCHNNSSCGTSNYQAYVDNTSGDFQNYVWNDAIGWISLNCANHSGCATSNYKVNSSWVATTTTASLISSTFDTGVTAGAQLNSVLWHGNQPSGTAVRFQFAVSNSSSGPWTYKGTDGTANTYYTTSRDVSLKLDYVLHNNKRYFRYKTFLETNSGSTVGPRVDDIIVNWSP